jgi:hypothetical protein
MELAGFWCKPYAGEGWDWTQGFTSRAKRTEALPRCVLFSGKLLPKFCYTVIWRLKQVFSTIGKGEKNFRPFEINFRRPRESHSKELAMMTNCVSSEGFEISPRFRSTVEKRIARLEKDAELDEAHAALLVDGDHIRRHMQLVAVERAEALRMRLFLDRARIRMPRPPVEL